MANLSLFSKIISIANNSRLLLNNRIPHSGNELINRFKSNLAEQVKHLPEKPKRPLSAFVRYSMEQRNLITKQNPQLNFMEISKKCADDWKNVDQSTKEKYLNDYKKQMETYVKEYAEYSAKLTDEQKLLLKEFAEEKKDAKEKRIIRKRFKETNKPKRALTSYIFFTLEQTKLEKKQLRDILPQLKEKWSKLSPEEKEKYIKMANDDKKRYEEEMKIWEKKMLQDGNIDLVRSSTLNEYQAIRTEKLSSTDSKSTTIKKPTMNKKTNKIDKE